MARSGSHLSGQSKLHSELKTALSALGRDIDAVVAPQLITFNARDVTAGAIRYLYPWHSLETAGVSERRIIMTRDCTVGRLYIAQRTAGTGSGSVVITVRRNQTSTDLVASMLATSTAGANNRSDTVSYKAGDTLSVQISDTGTVATSPVDIMVSLEVT